MMSDLVTSKINSILFSASGMALLVDCSVKDSQICHVLVAQLLATAVEVSLLE